MSILNGIIKTKKYRLLNSGNYRLQSEWTSSDTVYIGKSDTSLSEQLNNMDNSVAMQVENLNGKIDLNNIQISQNYELKTYASWEQLGLDKKNATIPKIVEKMASSSIAVLVVDENGSSSICPNEKLTNGTLIVHKNLQTRTLFLFETTAATGKLYQGSYYKTSEKENWSGWKKVMTADNFVVNGTTLNITTT